jgi:demethoxyubiquinone hydroxylase (CLK1/Coq7/Cat5 family)
MPKTEQQLNSLLQGELSAVETYNMALEKITEPAVNAVLLENRDCHSDRAVKLESMVSAVGGTPAKSSGAWGAFAKLVEAGATILGTSSALGSLKEGEDQGLDSYNAALKNLDDVNLRTVESDFLPAQEKTRDRLMNLLENMAAANKSK